MNRTISCTCHSLYGCDEHGPQPRDHQIQCMYGCGRLTMTVSGICEVCSRKGTVV